MNALSKVSPSVNIVSLPTTGSLRAIEISSIDVPSNHRKPDPDWVAALREDMAIHGQHTPIQVVEFGERFHLIKGLRRILAVQQVGFRHVDAFVQSRAEFSSDAALQLRQISAQIMRRELSVLDRAMNVSAWRSIYETTTGLIRPGRKAIRVKFDPNSEDALDEHSDLFAGTFSEAAQRALGLNKEAVKRYLRIARIDGPVADRVALHPIADNQSELLALAAETADRQAAIADLLLSQPAGASSVAGAICFIDGKPPKVALAPWETFSERFTNLREPDQERFFEVHRAAIERWLVKRGN
ncbi:ParB N-terminal domain-containing protein [Shinella sp.]|uniref:ParB/RepB/Spo0J family partition protein n=1 Tax=Shinella sp. TaxID=1870904 RepID=UPI00258B02E1|nr:ParB N-terminal domain-containing protein [Shinella sp.]MCW5708712.1 ParB N-terminal domain-containing protein [Shinella sp.]